MRIMYDSVTAGDIPANALMVAGYIDGSYAWSKADWARFLPECVRVRIATSASTNDGDVLDVENGDATPAQAVAWCADRRAAGARPTVYCNAATWDAVKQAFANLQQPDYWIAYYDGGHDQAIPDGAIAHQYSDSGTSGGHYDLSSVADFWPGVDGLSSQEYNALETELANLRTVVTDNKAQADNRFVELCYERILGRTWDGTPSYVEIMNAGDWPTFLTRLIDTPEAKNYAYTGIADTAENKDAAVMDGYTRAGHPGMAVPAYLRQAGIPVGVPPTT